MGGFTAFRNHLLNLFPGAFRRQLPSETTFCLLIIDVMQFLAGKVKFASANEVFMPQNVAASVKEAIEAYVHSSEYRVTKGVVALLDTTKNVPTNKARTQQKRGATDELTILDETLFNRIAQERSGEIDHTVAMNWITQQPWRWPLAGDTIWRSNNLKFHLYRAVTEALLTMALPRGVKLVIDDGVLVSDTVYRQSATQMIIDHGFERASAYAQECLVASLARHHFTQRFTLKSGQTEPERLESTHVGEADVKIPRFIVHGNRTSSYLVVSQDTDIIFVLLLHLKTLLAGKSRTESEHFTLWLDTQTPQDKKMGAHRLYRFIDIKTLYYDILEFFAREYPCVKNPIETLVFLVYSLETDFTLPFDGALAIGPVCLWNTFSELHTPLARLRAHGYLRFNDFLHDEMAKGAPSEKEKAKMGVLRAKERTPTLPFECREMLRETLSYTYDETRDTYTIHIDAVSCQRFFYLLCQFRVCQDLVGLGYSAFDKKAKSTKGAPRKCILTVDELFAWTAEIERRLAEYRTEEEGLKRKALDMLVKPGDDKKLKTGVDTRVSIAATTAPVIRLPRQNSDSKFNIDTLLTECVTTKEDEIEEIEDEKETPKSVSLPGATNQANKKKLEELTRRPPPKDYGIPRVECMMARIYRIEWLMNYHQNGWKYAEYANNFANTIESLSCHGWHTIEMPQNEAMIARGDMNSAYFTSVFMEGEHRDGEIPFRVFKSVESDRIVNRHIRAFTKDYMREEEK